ncbi:hemagglutinin, partial [Proteus mirabilis]
VYGNVNDLNITSGLVTYNPQLENKVNSYGRISFFDGFGAYLNKINIKHGYGEIYFDKEAYRIIERKLNINSLFGNMAVYISYY